MTTMKRYSTDDVIAYMTDRGWGFGERVVFNELVVGFSRRDWCGKPLSRSVTVSRYGAPRRRDTLIRSAAREALNLRLRFPAEPPERYFDLHTMQIVWSTGPLRDGAGKRRSVVELTATER